MKTEKDIMNLWTPLPGEYGEFFSIRKESVAALQANRFILWEKGNKKYDIRTSFACGSYPRWTGSYVFWNDNRLDLASGIIYNMDILKKDFFENPLLPDASAKVQSGFRPITFAWSPEADFFVVSTEGFDNKYVSHSRLMLLNRDGTLKRVLWDGSDFGPKAICINSRHIIAGTRDTMIFTIDGNLAGILPGKLVAQRIHISENGKLLFIQNHESITLWETGCWKRTEIINGPWLNAAMSPDGKMMYAIDFHGSLSAGLISDSTLTMIPVATPDPLATIDAGEEYIVGSFARGDPVRWVLKDDLNNLIFKNL